MTPERYRECCNVLAWSPVDVAYRLGLSTDRAPARWIAGTHQVPEPVADWLERWTAFTLANPPPPPPVFVPHPSRGNTSTPTVGTT